MKASFHWTKTQANIITAFTIELIQAAMCRFPQKPGSFRVKNARLHDQKYKKLKHDGVTSLIKSEWSNPLHMVTKPSGGHRCCGDYRARNDITKSNRCPIPSINCFFYKLTKKQQSSKTDLILACHQIKMHPDKKLL